MTKQEVLDRMKQLYHDTGGILPTGKVIELEKEETEHVEYTLPKRSAETVQSDV
jgi:hypothetical protein